MSNDTAPTLSPEDEFFLRTFHYYPSLEWNAVFLACFCLLTVAHAVMWRLYGGRFMLILPITGVVELLGYALRIECLNSASLISYIVSTFCLLVGPIALAAVNYIVVAKLLRALNKSVWLFVELTPERFSKVFVIGDCACFFIQMSAGGLLAIADPALNKAGTAITIIGLVIQLIFFTAFTWITYRIYRDPEYKVGQLPELRPVFRGLAVTIVLLYIRNIYRVIQFSVGYNSEMNSHEWVFFAFESVPILLAFVAYAVWHFGKLLESKSVRPLWMADLESIKSASSASMQVLSAA